jgi:hypothetical protein
MFVPFEHVCNIEVQKGAAPYQQKILKEIKFLTDKVAMVYRSFSLLLALVFLAACQDQEELVKSSIYEDECPADYSYISRRYDLNTSAFCISQDLMAYDAKGRLSVRKDNLFAINVNKYTAEALCQSLGANYDLVSVAEYQAAALEVELLDTNWSNGVIGNGHLALSGDPVTILSGETLDGVGNNLRNSLSDASSSWTKEYLYSYSTPGYDFNVRAGEYYSRDLPRNVFNAPYDDAGKWFAPKGDYRNISSMSPGDDGGMGTMYLNSGPGVLVRGAFSRQPFRAFYHDPSSISYNVGFHCVFHLSE